MTNGGDVRPATQGAAGDSRATPSTRNKIPPITGHVGSNATSTATKSATIGDVPHDSTEPG